MLPLKVVHLNQSDTQGGAAVAAYRLHKSLLNQNIDSELWVDKKISNDPTVVDLNPFIIEHDPIVIGRSPVRP